MNLSSIKFIHKWKHQKTSAQSFLTGGRRQPPTAALNKSPACVFSGNELTTEESSPLLLVDFLRESLVSLSKVRFCDDFELDAGDALVEPSLSGVGENPPRFSGFCARKILKLSCLRYDLKFNENKSNSIKKKKLRFFRFLIHF